MLAADGLVPHELSTTIARAGLDALLRARLPRRALVEGRALHLSAAREPDGLRVRARWQGGGLALRVRASAARGSGGLALVVTAEAGRRAVLRSSLERSVRNALEGGLDHAALPAWNACVAREDDRAAGRSLARLGARGRAIAARAGLPSGARVELGRLSLFGDGWRPDASTVLSRLVLLAVIKAHLHGRSGAPLVTGTPLFALEPEWEELPTREALGEAAGACDDDDDDGHGLAADVDLTPEDVEVDDLVLPAGLVARCCAALSAGKHLLLLGPPGTGKSTLAERLGRAAADTGVCRAPVVATASGDWTTYETIGGLAPERDQTLGFREGVVTRALRERRWLVIDELNRADVDRCLGELLTVLAGGTATTPYTRLTEGREVPIRIGPDERPYGTGRWFRLVATMNVRDRASLFSLSSALYRRFAVVHVPPLDDDGLRALAAGRARAIVVDDAAAALAARALCREGGLGAVVPLGPALLLDVLRYAARRRGEPVRAVGEAVMMLVLPQLEGVDERAAREALARLGALFAADASVAAELRACARAMFPHVDVDR